MKWPQDYTNANYGCLGRNLRVPHEHSEPTSVVQPLGDRHTAIAFGLEAPVRTPTLGTIVTSPKRSLDNAARRGGSDCGATGG
jgi:hypothetical protein